MKMAIWKEGIFRAMKDLSWMLIVELIGTLTVSIPYRNSKIYTWLLRGRISKKGAFFFSPERATHTSPGQRPGKLLKKILSPVRALHKWAIINYCSMCLPFRAQIIVMYYPGRCPGLVCAALSGLRKCPLFWNAPLLRPEKLCWFRFHSLQEF